MQRKPIALYLLLTTNANGYDVDRIAKNRHNYAALHPNIKVFWQSQVDPNTTFVPWQKVKDYKRLKDNHDWIWYLDADAFIMSNRSLDDLLDTKANIIVSRDCNNLNTGSFFLRPSAWTDAFVEHWLSLENDISIPAAEVWWEQAAFIQMVEKNWGDVFNGNNMKLVHQSLINSYPPGCGAEYKPGDLVVHGAGRGKSFLGAWVNENGFKEV